MTENRPAGRPIYPYAGRSDLHLCKQDKNKNQYDHRQHRFRYRLAKCTCVLSVQTTK